MPAVNVAVGFLPKRKLRFHLPIRKPETLKLFVKKAFGVTFPDTKVCPGHSTPWQAFCDAYFCVSSMVIWKGSRGLSGKSFTLATLGLTEAITLKCDVNILGGSGLQSQRVHDYQVRHWLFPRAPRHLLASDPLTMKTRLVYGNTIQALLASQNSVRGPHVQRLRLDEIDEMQLDIFDASMGQTMELNDVTAQTVASSTYHNPDGTMAEVLKRADEKGWPIYEWCYRETVQPHGWLKESEIERKKNETTSVQWQVEYELGEPSHESRAIMMEAVDAMFDARLGEFAGVPGEYIEIERPDPDGVYVHGADWAKDVDWTIIVTLRVDVRPYRVVAFLRIGRRPWPVMIRALDDRIERFGGEACHDATGLGNVVNDYLKHDAEPVVMTGRDRDDLFTAYIAAIERGEIEAPKIRYMEGEHRYCKVDDLYGSGHPPDTIVGGAMAYRAIKRKRVRVL
ncbi:MAG TPA: hypothetical protein VNL14_16810 [Candidatus Acidoferrales bacterium]|nr:hypothetical protein [Candidatus Acidoferrales bacterium]